MKVALLIYPDFELLDLAPVQTVLSMAPDAQVYLVWKNKELVPASGGFPVQPTVTFDECPRDLGSRDVFARVLHGGRAASAIGVAVTTHLLLPLPHKPPQNS